ncbi:hypothetical protein OH76DRAFT_531162 [Lentinus brumalis]|uniref:Uncharacterized protein n=1 Tax=Lentinus brumalis TaxID=2498619 RepID=A0A371DA82_9APHY|nr:hypothetical protein OH76DRAFT_531162 [Polyporus brumalis]
MQAHDAAKLTHALLQCDDAYPMSFDQLRISYVKHYIENNLSDYIITCLELCKGRKPPYHEYILAHVSRREDPLGRTVPCGVLRAERSMGEPGKPALKVISIFAAQFSTLASNIPAVDRVTICDTSECCEDIVLYRAGLQSGHDAGKTWAIHEFISAGLAIHAYAPNYHLVFEQCYWFAGLFFRLLVGHNAVDFEVERAAVKRIKGKHGGIWKGIKQDKHVAGNFGRMFQLLTSTQLREQVPVLQTKFSERVVELERSLDAEKQGFAGWRAAQASMQSAS